MNWYEITMLIQLFQNLSPDQSVLMGINRICVLRWELRKKIPLVSVI